MNRQRGSALLISLMLLVVFTLLAVSAINLSTVNLRIVSNFQAKRQAEARIQDAIEQVIANPDNFSLDDATDASGNIITDTSGNPIPKKRVTLTISVGTDSSGNPINVSVGPRECLFASPNDGYSIRATPPSDTFWRMTGVHTSPDGASASITQGTRILLQGGNC